ncbi:MAG TPA: ABC transporter substrate-binding protein [Mycobacteriales bacterium]|nr:ABC transporter substrate-binding protein [Mycobacteriales bacterium]
MDSSTLLSRRSAVKAGGAAVAASALAGCGIRGLTPPSHDSSTLQMTFWGEGDQNKRLIAALDLFERQHAPLKIATQYSGLDGYYDKLATRLAGGDPPDIFQIHLPYLLEYVRRGAVASLDPYAKDLGLTSVPDYIATTSKLDGHWYFALVGAATQPAIVYDRTRLEEKHLQPAKDGWTLDDFQDQMRQVHSDTGGKLYGSADLGGNAIAFESYLHGRAMRLFDDTGQLAFKPDDFSEWLQMWDSQRKAGGCLPMSETAAATGFQNDPVITGKSAFTLTATSRGLPSMQTLTKDTLRLLPFPAATRGGAPGTNIIPAGWFAVAKRSRNIEGAVALLKFLSGSKQASRAMQLARGVPIASDLQAVIAPDLTGVNKLVFDNYQQIARQKLVPLQPYPPGSGELLQTSLPTANQTVGFGKGSVSSVTDQFFSDAKRLLT